MRTDEASSGRGDAGIRFTILKDSGRVGRLDVNHIADGHGARAHHERLLIRQTEESCAHLFKDEEVVQNDKRY